MKKYMLLFLSFVLASFVSLSFAEDLDLAFEDDTDLANWSHHDEANVFTVEAWDATGGVDGTGGLHFTDGGFTFLVKRPITAVMGGHYSMTIDVHVDVWTTGDLALSVQGLSTNEPTVNVVTDTTNSMYHTYTLFGTADLSDSGYVRLHSTGSSTAPTVFVDNLVFDDNVQTLFFSEYQEGSSNHKGLEIYNPTDAAVSLTDYQIFQTSNGSDTTQWEFFHNFPEGASIEPGDVWVIVTDQADPFLQDVADEILGFPSVVHHNGDDARAIARVVGADTTLLDLIGVTGPDPGSGWDVAGVENATANHTLVRKETVMTGNADWVSSAGTNADDSEWIVYDQNTWDYLGAHPGMPVRPIMVTLRVNLSTNLDTVNAENGYIEVRGALNNWTTGAVLPDSTVIDWSTASDLDMHNVGGDYWEVTFKMLPEDTLRYKFWTGYWDGTNGSAPGGGYEGPFSHTNPGFDFDTRAFVSGHNDTVEVLQYYNPDDGRGAVDQYAMPFENKADSVAVYFRVSMAGEIEAAQFNPDLNGPVAVRGDGATSGSTLDWGVNNVVLTRETGSQFDGSFYSGVGYFPKDSVTEGGNQPYKFVFGDPGVTWEDYPGDRIFTYPGGLADTTLNWVYFSNKKPTGKETVTSVVTWRVSTEALEAIGLFDRGVGDFIEVRGPNGWDAGDGVQLVFNPLLQEWTSTNEEFTNQEGAEIAYKYFIGWDSSRVDSTSPNYIPNLEIGQGWEEPAPTGGGNRIHVFENAAEQSVSGDFGFDRQFFNGVPANAVSDHNITVTFNVDMTQSTESANNSNTLFRPGVDTVWVQWDGELTAWSQGTPMWDEDARFLELTDGDGDMVYSGTYTLEVSDTFPGIWYQLGYRIAYSTADGEGVVNGTGGAVRGRRYYQYIHPTSVVEGSGQWLDTVWPSDFDLPQVLWTETDLLVEDPPNLTVTAIVDNGRVPEKFALEQNYPNPFNPTTTIRYNVAKNADVKLKIYNLMGQEVLTLVDQNHNAGKYEIVWNAKNNLGKNVSSGVYYLKYEAGDFVKFRKMTLIR